MADNTVLNPGVGGDTISTDELTTLNGGAVSGVKVERVKVGYGSDGSLRDVDTANGLPVQISDGTDIATVIPRDGSSASTDKGLAVVRLAAHRPFYQVVTTEITSATTTGVKENLTLWHPASVTKDVFIVEIGANVRVVQTAGTFGWELQFISAENGTPGGTTLTPQQLRRTDAASGLTVRQVPTGAPTATGAIFQKAAYPLPAAATPFTQPEAFIIYSASDRDEYSDAIQLQNGQAEGLRISQNVAAALTTAPIFTLYVKYVERS